MINYASSIHSGDSALMLNVNRHFSSVGLLGPVRAEFFRWVVNEVPKNRTVENPELDSWANEFQRTYSKMRINPGKAWRKEAPKYANIGRLTARGAVPIAGFGEDLVKALANFLSGKDEITEYWEESIKFCKDKDADVKQWRHEYYVKLNSKELHSDAYVEANKTQMDDEFDRVGAIIAKAKRDINAAYNDRDNSIRDKTIELIEESVNNVQKVSGALWDFYMLQVHGPDDGLITEEDLKEDYDNLLAYMTEQREHIERVLKEANKSSHVLSQQLKNTINWAEWARKKIRYETKRASGAYNDRNTQGLEAVSESFRDCMENVENAMNEALDEYDLWRQGLPSAPPPAAALPSPPAPGRGTPPPPPTAALGPPAAKNKQPPIKVAKEVVERVRKWNTYKEYLNSPEFASYKMAIKRWEENQKNFENRAKGELATYKAQKQAWDKREQEKIQKKKEHIFREYLKNRSKATANVAQLNGQKDAMMAGLRTAPYPVSPPVVAQVSPPEPTRPDPKEEIEVKKWVYVSDGSRRARARRPLSRSRHPPVPPSASSSLSAKPALPPPAKPALPPPAKSPIPPPPKYPLPPPPPPPSMVLTSSASSSPPPKPTVQANRPPPPVQLFAQTSGPSTPGDSSPKLSLMDAIKNAPKTLTAPIPEVLQAAETKDDAIDLKGKMAARNKAMGERDSSDSSSSSDEFSSDSSSSSGEFSSDSSSSSGEFSSESLDEDFPAGPPSPGSFADADVPAQAAAATKKALDIGYILYLCNGQSADVTDLQIAIRDNLIPRNLDRRFNIRGGNPRSHDPEKIFAEIMDELEGPFITTKPIIREFVVVFPITCNFQFIEFAQASGRKIATEIYAVWKVWAEKQPYPVTFVIETNYSQSKEKEAANFLKGMQQVADQEDDWSAQILKLIDLSADEDPLPEIKGNIHFSLVHTPRRGQASLAIGLEAETIRARRNRRRIKKKHCKKRKAIDHCIGALLDFNSQYADSTSKYALPIF